MFKKILAVLILSGFVASGFAGTRTEIEKFIFTNHVSLNCYSNAITLRGVSRDYWYFFTNANQFVINDTNISISSSIASSGLVMSAIGTLRVGPGTWITVIEDAVNVDTNTAYTIITNWCLSSSTNWITNYVFNATPTSSGGIWRVGTYPNFVYSNKFGRGIGVDAGNTITTMTYGSTAPITLTGTNFGLSYDGTLEVNGSGQLGVNTNSWGTIYTNDRTISFHSSVDATDISSTFESTLAENYGNLNGFTLYIDFYQDHDPVVDPGSGRMNGIRIANGINIDNKFFNGWVVLRGKSTSYSFVHIHTPKIRLESSTFEQKFYLNGTTTDNPNGVPILFNGLWELTGTFEKNYALIQGGFFWVNNCGFSPGTTNLTGTPGDETISLTSSAIRSEIYNPIFGKSFYAISIRRASCVIFDPYTVYKIFPTLSDYFPLKFAFNDTTSGGGIISVTSTNNMTTNVAQYVDFDGSVVNGGGVLIGPNGLIDGF